MYQLFTHMKWIVCFTLSALWPLAAQTPAPATPAAAPKKAPHSLRLLCVEAAEKATQLVVAEKTDKGWQARWRLTVSSSFMTDAMGFGTRKLALAIDPAPPKPQGGFNGPAVPVKEELLVQPISEFELPASDTATAILVTNSDPKASPYRVILIDAQSQRFGDGKILVQNFTTHNIAGLFGGKSAKLASGQSTIIEPGIDQAADMAQITLAKQVGEQWEPFCDTRWPGKTEYRRYLLLIPRADGSIHPFVMPEYPPYR
jgi:hypothetical protein